MKMRVLSPIAKSPIVDYVRGLGGEKFDGGGEALLERVERDIKGEERVSK